MKKPVALLDACVWLRGIAFPDLASGYLLYLAMVGEIKIVASPILIEEVRRNLRRADRPHFPVLVQTVSPSLVNLTDQELLAWSELVPLKDCHVLAAALKGNADVLVTLDADHILKRKVRQGFPLPVLDPDACVTWLSGRRS